MRRRSHIAALQALSVADYVLAITDSVLPARTRTRWSLHEITMSGIHAVCERRRRVPPVSDDALLAQHEVVLDIARHVRAILPVRFGTLLTRDALQSLLEQHRDQLARALDEVRDRVQMTVRVRGIADERGPSSAASGRQYLEARGRASRPELPPAVDAFLAAVRPLAVQERREPAAAGLLATIYHLVHRDALPAYERNVKTMAPEDVIVTGPWPPFAFVPRLI